MKISESIRQEFNSQKRVADRIKDTVDRELLIAKQPNWHYESRVKTEQSFALKLECGRVIDPRAVEDMFACVIVVPTFDQIEVARDLIVDKYQLRFRRPGSEETTTKSPTDFRFDDLRLYVTYVDSDHLPPTGLTDMVFEVQVRTFLQHAWTVATHDLVYKAESVSWRRERIAAHAKAALEQAEVTIESLAYLEQSAAIPKTTKNYTTINAVIETLKSNWEPALLPVDIKRLATGVFDLLAATGCRDELSTLLDIGRQRYNGQHNIDWSPYYTVLRYLAEQRRANLIRLLSSKDKRQRWFIYPSILAVLGMDPTQAPRAVVLAE